MTDPRATVDSMLRLHDRTLAFCFWYFLLVTLHKQALADEEALWGTRPSREQPGDNPPATKPSSYWWGSSLPKFPSLPSPPFRIPFYSWGESSDSKDEAAALTTTAKGLTEPIDHLRDHSGSGEEGVSEASEPPTTSTQGFLPSVTVIRAESLPTGTSDSPHSSVVQSDNDGLVLDSYSPRSTSITNTLFTNSPTSTNAAEQNATHTHPPQSTPGPSMGATTQHLTKEHTDKEEIEDSSKEPSTAFSTIAPETTVPTALIWAPAQTVTTNPGTVQTTQTRHPLVGVNPATSSETMFVTTPDESTVNIRLNVGEATMMEAQPTQSEADLGFSEARSGPVEEHPGIITTALRIDHKQVPGSITSTTQGQKVNFPITRGKQSYTNQ